MSGGFTGQTRDIAGNRGTAVEAYHESFEGDGQGIRLSHRYNANILAYANFTKLSFDPDLGNSDNADGDAFGVVLPTSFGHVYAAAEHIDDNLFGMGLRYDIR